jgi:DNA polymerase-4
MAILAALGELWERVTAVIPPTTKIMRVSVTLGELTLDGTTARSVRQ